MNKPRTYKIIIADDEPDTRFYLKSMLLKKYAVDVVDVGDGEGAVAQARSFNPDIMLLDVHMPRLDGWGVIKEVRSFNSVVKFIVITGWETMTDDHRQILDDHVAAYMHKPVSFEAVAEKMFEVLGPDFQKTEMRYSRAPSEGRSEAREIVHTLANIHSLIRMKCEYFVFNLEEGYFKDKSEAQLLNEARKVMREIATAVDRASPAVEEIRKL